jgi:hypothetical protein
MEACGIPIRFSPMEFLGFQPESHVFQNCIFGFAAIMFLLLGLIKFIKDRRASQRRPRLVGEEVSQVVYNDYGSINTFLGERQFTREDYFFDHPRGFFKGRGR